MPVEPETNAMIRTKPYARFNYRNVRGGQAHALHRRSIRRFSSSYACGLFSRRQIRGGTGA
jgi:hypothetical protein